jgi:hypothetical protein
VNDREALEAAIAAARPYCIECGSDVVVAEYRAGHGWIPVSCHYAETMATACPVLRGGLAALLCHEDLWAALEPHLFLAHYGELAGTGVIR